MPNIEGKELPYTPKNIKLAKKAKAMGRDVSFGGGKGYKKGGAVLEKTPDGCTVMAGYKKL